MEPAGFPVHLGLKRERGHRFAEPLDDPVLHQDRFLWQPLLRFFVRRRDLSPVQNDDLLQAKLPALLRFLLRLALRNRFLMRVERLKKQRLPKPHHVAFVRRHIL